MTFILTKLWGQRQNFFLFTSCPILAHIEHFISTCWKNEAVQFQSLKAFSCPLMLAAGCPLVPHAQLSEAASYRSSHIWLCLWSGVCSISLVFIAGLHSQITMTDCTWTTYKCINHKANCLCILHIFPQKLGHPCFLFNTCPLPELRKLASWDAIHY